MHNIALIEIGICCSAILLLVLYQYSISLLQFPEERTFKKILVLMLAETILDIAGKLQLPERFSNPDIKYVIGVFTAALTQFIPYLWNLFIHYKIYGSAYHFRKYSIPITIPLVMGLLYCVTRLYQLQPGHKELNMAELWIITNSISIFYIAMASVISLRSAHKNYTKTGWRQEQYFCWIMVIPVIAILVQIALQRLEIPIVTPVITLVLLHIHISQQNTLITMDQLTGLNNERRLNSYLRDKTADLTSEQRLFLLTITLDNMRHIRRKCGKKKTEEIIVAFANFLRARMTSDNMFLAHYQKYSFAIVLEKKTWNDVESFCNMLVSTSNTPKLQGIAPWPITFSINYSEFGKPGVNNVIDFLDDTRNNCFKPTTSLYAKSNLEP
jgi:GGDEF domain-containing protein